MSKRKSSSQTLQTADMQFEDDDEIEQQSAGSTKASQDSREKSRVSVRAKKAKAIYDPSQYNGPVHKRKKEALEQQQPATESPRTGPFILPRVMQCHRRPKSFKPDAQVKASPIVKSVPVIIDTKPEEPKLEPKSPKKPATTQYKKLLVEPVPLAKEPSKRIQARKQRVVHNEASTSAPAKSQRKPSVTSTLSDEYDRASTVEFRSKDVPDVRKWTHQQVFEYFSKNLGFSTHDAAVFSDEEIDGEALMIMKRSDIVTTKFQKLKLGTALKMWSNIMMFQTGSNDPTQAWK